MAIQMKRVYDQVIAHLQITLYIAVYEQGMKQSMDESNSSKCFHIRLDIVITFMPTAFIL